MANLEIGESSSHSIIKVGYELTMIEDEIDVSSALIFRVPQPLRDCNDHLYSPHLVSIGPFHYGKEELKGMEKSKSEAVQRMQKRIQSKDRQPSIESIVKKRIVEKDKEIRNFYGEQILYRPIELAWMITRDACFIFEFLVNYVGYGKTGSKTGRRLYEEEVNAFSFMYDPVFDVTYQNPTREKLMEDILLFENQIPLSVLKDLLQIRMGSPEAAQKKLDDLMGLVLGHAIYFEKGVDTLKAICGRLCQLCLQFPSSNTSPGEARQTPPSPHDRMPIWFKKGVDSLKAICGGLCKLCLRFSSSSSGEAVSLILLKLPTALELSRAGVKICPVLAKDQHKVVRQDPTTLEEGYAAIRWIRFDEKTSTLYLPQMRVTPQSDSVIRNIIAMELSIKNRYNPRPMTQFVMFMDELIDSEEDVDVLRMAEVIDNFLGRNEQVASLFNSLATGINSDYGCKVIDDARRGLRKYTRRKYKILWSEFVSAYFSKPWLVAGSMAAMLLLLMTVAQVFCLFFTCNPQSS